MPKKNKAQPQLIIDQREQTSAVVQELSKFPLKLQFSTLHVADYILSHRVGIERKTTADFLASITDRRLFQQMKDLVKAFPHPVLILEGTNLYSSERLHPNAIRGALSYLAILQDITIIPTIDPADTAAILYIMSKHEQFGLPYQISLNHKPQARSLQEYQRRVVQALPEVGPATAHALLRNFGSVQKVMSASLQQLLQVNRIGQKRARKLLKLLEAEYQEEE